MGSVIRWIGIGIGAIVLLLVAAVAFFALTFDTNDLKEKLVTATAEETGRELTIEGDIKLSLFPYIGFTLGPTRLADAEGFGDQPFLSLEGAAASVRLLPLVTGNFEVGEVRLEGVNLKAVTAADGRNNWDDLAALGGAEDAPAEPAGGGGGDVDLARITIGGIKLSDAQLSYEDRASGTRYAITDWDLSTGTFRVAQPLEIDTSLNLEATNPDLAGKVAARGTLTPDNTRTVLNNPDISVQVSGSMLEALSALDLSVKAEQLMVDASGPFELKAPTIRAHAESADFGEPLDARIQATSLSGNLNAQTLTLTDLTAEAWDMTMRGELRGRKILDAPDLNGTIAIDEFSPKRVAEKAGAPLSPTVDPQALTRAALKGNFAITPTSARFSDIELMLDDSRFTGQLAVADFERQALRFDLKGDQLILDRYMTPAPEQPVEVADDVAIPAEDIRSADIDGKLSLEQLMLSGLTATNAQVTLKAANGTLRIHPSTADMYGGKYEGDIRIDASGELPTLSLNERLSKVDFGALGRDVFDQQNLTGQLDARITLSGTGATQSAILGTLNGDAQFSFLDGALLGIDLAHEVRKGMAVIGMGSAPSGSGDDRTEFAELSGTAQVTNGVMRNDDLVARLPFILGRGKGTVDLRDESLDYRLDLQFQKSPELPDGASDLLGRNLPIGITGTLSVPRPDFGDTAAALARQRVEKEVDKLKDRVIGDLVGGGEGDDGDSDKSDVKKVLGGLFGGKKDKDKKKDDEGDNR